MFSFDKGEEISTHSSHGDAMVYIIDGTASITIGEEIFNVKAGETILMPAEIPHAIAAPERHEIYVDGGFLDTLKLA